MGSCERVFIGMPGRKQVLLYYILMETRRNSMEFRRVLCAFRLFFAPQVAAEERQDIEVSPEAARRLRIVARLELALVKRGAYQRAPLRRRRARAEQSEQRGRDERRARAWRYRKGDGLERGAEKSV